MPCWCSPANHFALSRLEKVIERRRPGFESRTRHFSNFLRILVLPFPRSAEQQILYRDILFWRYMSERDKSIAFDFFGFGNPMVEATVEVDFSFIDKFGLKKDASNVFDDKLYDEVERELERLGIERTEQYAGGSIPNQLAGLSSLGEICLAYGGVGLDKDGKYLDEDFRENYGLETLLVKGGSFDETKGDVPGDTFTLLTLITPDNQRTFVGKQGAAVLNGRRFLVREVKRDIAIAEYFLVSGYKVQDSPYVSSVLFEFAKEHGTKIVLDLSCGVHINKSRGIFDEVLCNRVDVLLANEEETLALTGIGKGSDIQRYIDATIEYLQFSNIVAHKIGDRGMIVSSGTPDQFWYEHIPAEQKIINIQKNNNGEGLNFNGAGDGFAVGFLYGLKNYPQDLRIAGKLGNHCAAQIIRQVQPRKFFDKSAIDNFARRYINKLA